MSFVVVLKNRIRCIVWVEDSHWFASHFRWVYMSIRARYSWSTYPAGKQGIINMATLTNFLRDLIAKKCHHVNSREIWARFRVAFFCNAVRSGKSQGREWMVVCYHKWVFRIRWKMVNFTHLVRKKKDSGERAGHWQRNNHAFTQFRIFCLLETFFASQKVSTKKINGN